MEDETEDAAGERGRKNASGFSGKFPVAIVFAVIIAGMLAALVFLAPLEPARPAGPTPTLTDSTPGNGSTGVSTADSPTLTFDQPMDPASTVAASSIVPAVPGGSFSVANSVLKFAHPSPLDEYVAYTVHVDASAKSAKGVPLASRVSIGFLTRYSVTDDRGARVDFAAPPQRVVSIAPSATEFVCIVGACGTLKAVDNNSDFPAEVAAIGLRVYGYKWLDREGFKIAAPDVVFASGINAGDFDLIEKQLGYKLVVLDAKDLEGVYGNVELAGKVFRADSKERNVTAGLRQKADEIKTKIAQATMKPKVYHEIDSWGGYWTFGPGSFGNALIEMGGGVNCAAAAPTSYPTLTSEEIIACDPGVITVSWSPAWGGPDPDEIRNRTGWGGIEAIVKDRFVALHTDLIERPGPRLVLGFEAFAKAIHPELFP